MITFEEHFKESPMSLKWRVDFLPGQVFRTCFPEDFSARSGRRRRFLIHCRKDLKFDWRFGDGRAEADGADPIGRTRLVFSADERQRSLHWSLSFENTTDTVLEHVSAFNCLNLANTPLFRDLPLARTRVRDGQGEWVALKEVSKTLGPDTFMQYYPVAGGIDLQDRMADAKQTGWGISPALLSGDRIVVDSVDGRWRLENIVEGPLAYFFTNWAPSDAGCIHAAPLFGDVRPGQKVTVRGQIAFTPRN